LLTLLLKCSCLNPWRWISEGLNMSEWHCANKLVSTMYVCIGRLTVELSYCLEKQWEICCVVCTDRLQSVDIWYSLVPSGWERYSYISFFAISASADHYYYYCYYYSSPPLFGVFTNSQRKKGLTDQTLLIHCSDKTTIIIIIIIIIIVEFFTSHLWLWNIHLSCDVVINRIRLGGLICSLKRSLQLNMCQELQISAAVCMYWGVS